MAEVPSYERTDSKGVKREVKAHTRRAGDPGHVKGVVPVKRHMGAKNGKYSSAGVHAAGFEIPPKLVATMQEKAAKIDQSVQKVFARLKKKA